MRRQKKEPKVNRYLSKISEQEGQPVMWQAITSFVRERRHGGMPLVLFAKELGVTEIVQEEMPFEGGLYQEDGRLIIKLNAFSSKERRHFTLAHELGHLLLAPVTKASLDCVADQDLEDACDAVAAELLMPAEEIFRVAREFGRPSPMNLEKVAAHFGVSLWSAARRLHYDLDHWKPRIGLWEWDGSARQKWFVGKRFWTQEEPPFGAFGMAAESFDTVRTREFYQGHKYCETVSLEVLNLGNNKLLGFIGAIN